MNDIRPRAVVVGTGFGLRTLVPALRAAGFEVAGLVGTDAERTRRRADSGGVALAFTDLDEAIVRTGAKVVAVATPPHTHAPLSLLAISRGCHVLCEKPFARDVAEARTLLEAAERAGIAHVVGHEFRYMPDRSVAARAITDGLIGRPRFLTLASFMPLVAAPEAKMPPWWFDREAGGGWLGAHGSHIIDQVRTWLGEFESVSASLPMTSARAHGAEDSYSLRFRLGCGVEGVMQSSAGAWGPVTSMARLSGTLGTLWVEGGTVRVADLSGTRELPVPPDLALPPAPATDLASGQRAQPAELGAYTRLCEALRDGMEGGAMRSRGASGVPTPTFADGLAGMQVLDAIRASAAGGGALVSVG